MRAGRHRRGSSPHFSLGICLPMPTEVNSQQKQQLRKLLRQRRQQLSAAYRQQAANRLARLWLRQPGLRRAKRIALYWPMASEISVLPLLNLCLALRRQVYLPQLAWRTRKRMWFVRLRQGQTWQYNRFNIPEPQASHCSSVRALDLVLLPVVGFDGNCNRLGQGGGFYDASLQFLRQRRHWKRPRIVGIAYDCQRVTQLPLEPWDVPLDAVLTEKCCYLPSRDSI